MYVCVCLCVTVMYIHVHVVIPEGPIPTYMITFHRN